MADSLLRVTVHNCKVNNLSLSLFLSYTHVHPPASLTKTTIPRIELHWFTVHLVLWLKRAMASNKFNFAVVQNTDLFSIGHCMLRIHLHSHTTTVIQEL